MLNDIKGSRKFIFVLVACACATFAVLFGKIDAGVFADLMKWLGGFFVVGNAIENVTNAVAGN